MPTRPLRRPLLLALVTAVSTCLVPVGAGAYVYWANAGAAGKLGRRELDGTGVTGTFDTNGPACGVAVYGTHFYWTEPAAPSDARRSTPRPRSPTSSRCR